MVLKHKGTKTQRILAYCLILCSLIFPSCTEEITIHTDNSEPVIVIYGILTDRLDYQSVKINTSSPYFDDQPNKAISGAEVTITDSENNEYTLLESKSEPGIYLTTTRWSAQIGVDYFLRVEVDFDSDGVTEVYEASTSILPVVDDFSIEVRPINIMGHKNYSIDLYAYETPGEDYYLCKYLVNDSLVTAKISRYQVLDDTMFDGQYINQLTLTYFDDVSEWEDDDEEQRKESVYIKSGDKIELQMSKIPKGYYNFISQCQKEMSGSNPFFGGPASNITTNISNGGAGYFSGYCINWATAKTP